MKAIALIGFMGAGKSTVGRRLAEELDCTFVDLDAAIVQRAGKSVEEIFAADGEAYFRQLEQKTLQDFAMQENIILATGGGCVKQEENRAIMAKYCYRIYLACQPDKIAERVRNSNTVRPLLMHLASGETLEQRIETLLAQRLAYYQEHDLLVDTSMQSLEEVVAEIIRHLADIG